MAVTFNRWSSTQAYSWPFRVFKQYYEEQNLMYWSSIGTCNYIYHAMKADGLTWETDPTDILSISKNKYNFKTLREWSNGNNLSQVWSRLNFTMSLSAIFETYLSTIIALAIESDPGVLIHAPNSVDGTKFLKEQGFPRRLYDSSITGITTGIWSKRLSALSTLFNFDFPVLSNHLDILEKLRRKRNSVGHAYGRDISKSRQFLIHEKQPVEGVSNKNLLLFYGAVFKVAKEIDRYLLKNHIGEYQMILAYHNFLKANKPAGFTNDKAYAFSKHLGKLSPRAVTRKYCVELANHYESI